MAVDQQRTVDANTEKFQLVVFINNIKLTIPSVLEELQRRLVKLFRNLNYDVDPSETSLNLRKKTFIKE
ncbi:unnamed protein product [Candida parapsilosis]